MDPYQTANRIYRYNQIFHKKTLDKWTFLAHQYNCKENKWKQYIIKKGSFGYDCMAYCLAYTLETISNEYTLDEIAEMIHDAWAEIYTFWRDHKPWLNNKSYIKSAKPLNDTKRNELAETPYDLKPENEKNKDLIIAKFIMQSLYEIKQSKLNIYSIIE
jgi:hypothetical protein